MSKLNIESFIPIQYERACILSQSDAERRTDIEHYPQRPRKFKCESANESSFCFIEINH